MENKDLPNSIEQIANRVPENGEIIYAEGGEEDYIIKVGIDTRISLKRVLNEIKMKPDVSLTDIIIYDTDRCTIKLKYFGNKTGKLM